MLEICLSKNLQGRFPELPKVSAGTKHTTFLLFLTKSLINFLLQKKQRIYKMIALFTQLPDV